MTSALWMFIIPALFGLISAAGVWICYWYQRVGWSLTLSANLLLIGYGAWTGQWGFSIAVPLAAAAQVHHLLRTRDEPFTGRRIPGVRSRPARTRRRTFRHAIPLRYAPGRAVIETAAQVPVIVDNRVVGVACPCGCGTFAPSDFVGHLERNRGNLSHWAVANRR